jgi:hypothetical protein
MVAGTDDFRKDISAVHTSSGFALEQILSLSSVYML